MMNNKSTLKSNQTITIARHVLSMVLNICVAAVVFFAFAILCVSIYFTGFRLATVVSMLIDVIVFTLCVKDAYRNYVELKATELHIESMFYYIMANKEDNHNDNNGAEKQNY